MQKIVAKYLSKLAKREDGVSAVEYAILAAGIGGALLLGIQAFYGTDANTGLAGVFSGLLADLGI